MDGRIDDLIDSLRSLRVKHGNIHVCMDDGVGRGPVRVVNRAMYSREYIGALQSFPNPPKENEIVLLRATRKLE